MEIRAIIALVVAALIGFVCLGIKLGWDHYNDTVAENAVLNERVVMANQALKAKDNRIKEAQRISKLTEAVAADRAKALRNSQEGIDARDAKIRQLMEQNAKVDAFLRQPVPCELRFATGCANAGAGVPVRSPNDSPRTPQSPRAGGRDSWGRFLGAGQAARGLRAVRRGQA